MGGAVATGTFPLRKQHPGAQHPRPPPHYSQDGDRGCCPGCPPRAQGAGIAPPAGLGAAAAGERDGGGDGGGDRGMGSGRGLPPPSPCLAAGPEPGGGGSGLMLLGGARGEALGQRVGWGPHTQGGGSRTGTPLLQQGRCLLQGVWRVSRCPPGTPRALPCRGCSWGVSAPAVPGQSLRHLRGGCGCRQMLPL